MPAGAVQRDAWATVAAVAARFLADRELPAAMQHALAMLGGLCGADRVRLSLWRLPGTEFGDRSYAWPTEDAGPRQTERAGDCRDLLPTWMARLQRHEIVEITGVTAEPAAAQAERDLLRRDGIRSRIMIPAISGQGLAGCLALDNANADVRWREDDYALPRYVASVAVGAFLRKHTEDELERLIRAWRDTCDALLHAVALLDGEGRIERCNRAMALLLELPFPEIIGQQCTALLQRNPGWPISCMGHEPLPASGHFAYKDRWYEVHTDPLVDGEGTLCGGILVIADITERKLAEHRILSYQDRLRLLATEIALSEERGHRQLAADLHEQLNQSLALIKMHFDALCAMPAPDQGRLDHLRDLLERTISFTRTLTFDLFPPFLLELGLTDGAQWLAESLSPQSGLAIEVDGDRGSLALGEDLSYFLFRAIRELLVNIVQHARATRATVTIHQEQTTVTVAVTDDGIGFDTAQLEDHDTLAPHFGLFSLRERLLRLGGGMTIASQPGHGTRITLAVPCDAVDGGQWSVEGDGELGRG